jgi:hypothetical protein
MVQPGLANSCLDISGSLPTAVCLEASQVLL